VHIHSGSVERGRQTTIGCRQHQFSVFSLPVSLEILEIRHRDMESFIGFPLIPKHVTPSVTLNGHFVLNSVFTPVCLASETVTFESNYVKTNPGRPILSAANR